MQWQDVASSVAKAAPILGTALAGPLGGAIGGLVSILASQFGLTPEETTPDKINSLLMTDPNAAVKLAEIDANYKIELQKIILEQQKLEIQIESAELQDTANARQRETEVVKATGQKDTNLYVLAWVIVTGFFALTGTLIFHAIPLGQNEVVFMLFGGLVSGFSTVLGYFFGSSRGSAIKSQLLATENNKKSNKTS